MAIELIYLLFVITICSIIWVFSGTIASYFKSSGTEWWSMKTKIEEYFMYPFFFAYFGNLIGAIATLYYFSREEQTTNTLNKLIGHMINLIITVLLAIIMVFIAFNLAFDTIGRAID